MTQTKQNGKKKVLFEGMLLASFFRKNRSSSDHAKSLTIVHKSNNICKENITTTSY